MWIEILLLFLAVFIYFYYEVTKQFNFFKDRGIPYSKPSFPFGSPASAKMFTGKSSFFTLDSETIKSEGFENEKVVGFFSLGQPIYIINDEELAKHVLIKDFDSFMDRRTVESADKHADAFLTNLTGNEWKQVRSLMSGIFTSGKLKIMSKHIAVVGQNLENYISKIADTGEEVNIRVVGGQMTLDAIATSMFGLENDSFKEPDNAFRTMAMTLVGAPGYASQLLMFKVMLIFIFPKLMKFLNVNMVDQKAKNFFVDIISKTYQNRLKTGERRNDMIDLLIDEIKASKKSSNKEKTVESEQDENLSKTEFDDEFLMVSNALLFFFAGFDTSSQVFDLCAHKLALYPEYQDKVIEEIDDVIGDGPVTYDKLQELKYMEMFMMESFRNTDIMESHERMCTKDYKIPGTDYVVPKGRFVHVYFADIINSDKNFMNPTEFDPENFNPENNHAKFGNQIFGHGPRNCVGMRYGILVMKTAMVSLLRKHRVVRGAKFPEKIQLDIANPSILKDPVVVKFEKRN